MLPMVVEPFGLHWMLPAWLQLLLATPVQFVLGARFYRAGWKALHGAHRQHGPAGGPRHERRARGLSIYLLWHWAHGMRHLYFEASAVGDHAGAAGQVAGRRAPSARPRRPSARCRRCGPDRARVRRDGAEVELPLDGARGRRRRRGAPGRARRRRRRGRSRARRTWTNPCITGESLPVAKGAGRPGHRRRGERRRALVVVRATAVGHADRCWRASSELVESAQASKAPIQRLVDQVSAVFVPVVLVHRGADARSAGACSPATGSRRC